MTLWRNFLLAVIATLAGAQAGLAYAAPPEQRQVLADGWLLQSSSLVPETGQQVSTTAYRPDKWYTASAPSTVLGVLVNSGVYPDPRVGLDSYKIPDSSDEFNAEHDLAKYSHLPDKRNPWRDPYWYRKEFSLPQTPGRPPRLAPSRLHQLSRRGVAQWPASGRP